MALVTFLPGLAYKGFGFGRGLYGAVCVLSLLGAIFFFAAAAAPVHLADPELERNIPTVVNFTLFLGELSISAFIGSLLAVCVYRKPISSPKADKTQAS